MAVGDDRGLSVIEMVEEEAHLVDRIGALRNDRSVGGASVDICTSTAISAIVSEATALRYGASTTISAMSANPGTARRVSISLRQHFACREHLAHDGARAVDMLTAGG